MIELGKIPSKEVAVKSSPKNKTKKFRKHDSMTPEEALVALNRYDKKLRELDKAKLSMSQESYQKVNETSSRLNNMIDHGARPTLMVTAFASAVGTTLLGTMVDPLFFIGIASMIVCPTIDMLPAAKGLRIRIVGKSKVEKLEQDLASEKVLAEMKKEDYEKAQKKLIKKIKPVVEIVNDNLSTGTFHLYGLGIGESPFISFNDKATSVWERATLDIAQTKETLALEKTDVIKEIEA